MDIVEIGLLALAVVLVIGGGGVGIAVARPVGRELDRFVEAGVFAPEQAQELRGAWRSRSPGSPPSTRPASGCSRSGARLATSDTASSSWAPFSSAPLFLVGQMYNVEAHDALGFAVEAPRYERAMAERRLLAEVVLDDDGDAQLDDLVIEG